MDDCLHIYSPHAWHDPSYIIGTTLALKNLRNAIDKALENGGGIATSFVSDGEGFDAVVVKVDNEQELNNLILPYTEEIAIGKTGKVPETMHVVRKLIQDARDERKRKK
jgi:hypothetical protein